MRQQDKEQSSISVIQGILCLPFRFHRRYLEDQLLAQTYVILVWMDLPIWMSIYISKWMVILLLFVISLGELSPQYAKEYFEVAVVVTAQLELVSQLISFPNSFLNLQKLLCNLIIIFNSILLKSSSYSRTYNLSLFASNLK